MLFPKFGHVRAGAGVTILNDSNADKIALIILPNVILVHIAMHKIISDAAGRAVNDKSLPSRSLVR